MTFNHPFWFVHKEIRVNTQQEEFSIGIDTMTLQCLEQAQPLGVKAGNQSAEPLQTSLPQLCSGRGFAKVEVLFGQGI